jgi:hypothetical protein
MLTQALAWPTALAEYNSNTRIAIAAKLLVQFNKLLQLKCSPGQCLDDANTSQHLPIPGGLLHVVCGYIVDQSI